MTGGGGMLEYDMPMHAPQTYSHNTAPYSHSAHNRWEKKASASYPLSHSLILIIPRAKR